MILIFCAPSGSGKSTFVGHLLQKYPQFELSISATSRQPRGTEQHGIEYYFITAEEFKRLIEEDKLVEYQEVYDNYYYGTLKSEIARIQGAGKHVIFDVDVKGGINLKRIFGKEALAIFIQPPSIEELRNRLTKRNTDSAEMIEKRVRKATTEMEDADKFDRIIVNDNLQEALAKLEQVLKERELI